MFSALRNILSTSRGNLVENIIYIIVIGGLTFAFYTNNVQKPMDTNMENLNTKIREWTDPSNPD